MVGRSVGQFFYFPHFFLVDRLRNCDESGGENGLLLLRFREKEKVCCTFYYFSVDSCLNLLVTFAY